jgi:hypothetical protein
MKKMVFCLIPLIMVLMGCASSGTVAAETNSISPGMDMDSAIREAAAQMGENIPGGTKVALVSVASSSAQLSEYVISRLEAALVSGKKLVVVDRANLDKVREEQGFQASGEVDDDSAKSIGKLLGAGAIVTGAFADLGDVYSLTLKAINIETATVAVSYPGDIAKSTRIKTLLASGGGVGTGTRTTQTGGNAAPASQVAAPEAIPVQTEPVQTAVPASVPAQTPTVPPTPTVYKIGDKGPAGGIIFYANPQEGSWKYLEVAPANTEKVTFWATEDFPIDAIKDARSVGMGKSNTEYIMRAAVERGGGFDWAAEICDSLTVNGYDDWFLPSRDELHQMYGNLQRRGLGGFQSAGYWSSTPVPRKYHSDIGTSISAWFENFTNGEQNEDVSRAAKFRIRAIRQF